jgi:hypothetical protein
LVGALNSDMGVVWGLLCLHPNTIKPSHYSPLSFFLSNFADFVGGHFENGGHSLAIFFRQNILPTLLNIYAKFCGNPFGGFQYK